MQKTTFRSKTKIKIGSYQVFGFRMDSKEFISFRKKLNKTQTQMAQLLGTSVKAIQSYEQGWRSVPVHAERQLLFLIARINGDKESGRSCWTIKKCPPERKKKCPAWEFRAGDLCWFVNGTTCEGVIHENWKKKMKMCRSCDVFSSMV